MLIFSSIFSNTHMVILLSASTPADCTADRRSQFLAVKQEHAVTGRSVCKGNNVRVEQNMVRVVCMLEPLLLPPITKSDRRC